MLMTIHMHVHALYMYVLPQQLTFCSVPPEMLLPCSLLADHLGSNNSLEGPVSVS